MKLYMAVAHFVLTSQHWPEDAGNRHNASELPVWGPTATLATWDTWAKPSTATCRMIETARNRLAMQLIKCRFINQDHLQSLCWSEGGY